MDGGWRVLMESGWRVEGFEVAAASEYIARASTDTVTQAFSVSKVLNP